MRPDARACARLLALAGACLCAPAGAEEGVTRERLEALERRIEELERERDARESADLRADWTQRVRLSGSARGGFYGGRPDASDGGFERDEFAVGDARFFVDAELGRDVRLGGTTLARNVGFTFEWNLVRLGSLDNDVGELYVDFQNVLDSSWLSVQVGRFQIPVGENYLRFSRNYRDNPFVSNTVGGPWWWDEGLRIYGGEERGRFGYVLSVTNGETPFNHDADSDRQLTAKLWVRPISWLYLSASALRSGRIGDEGDPASGALWLGEAWARAFGAGSPVPNVSQGRLVPDGPDELDGSTFLGGDVVLENRLGRLWLAYGQYRIDSSGSSLYDRTLRTWIAELILPGRLLSPELEPGYLGLRGSALETDGDDEGYLLDVRYAPTLGYNMHRLRAWSVVMGWHLTRWVTLRLEYTLQQVELAEGAAGVVGDVDRHADAISLEVGAHF